MKRRLVYLAALTLLALLAVSVFSPRQRLPETSGAEELLLPEIAARINDVSRVEIVSAGNMTVATMLKTSTGWQLEQMDGYRADWSRLQALLAGLARAKVVENKTDKPEYYARLGVEDIVSTDAASILVRLGIGDQTRGVLIGHKARGRGGQYARLQTAATSVLTDGEFDLSTEQLDWADATIIDITASAVAEVEIIHPRGERVLATKIAADQGDFEWVDMPQDREIKSSWAINSLGTVFSMLDLETVHPDENAAWPGAVKIRLLMFSGVEIIAETVEMDGQYLVRMQADHPAAAVGAESMVETGEADGETVQPGDIEQRAAADVASTVAEINQRVVGWVYGIPKHKYDAIVKKPEDLLKPVDPA